MMGWSSGIAFATCGLLRSRAFAQSAARPGRHEKDARKRSGRGMGGNDRLALESGFLRKQRRAKARDKR
jgi:hypothetical protein